MAPSRKNARKTLKKRNKTQETDSSLCSDHDSVLNLNKMDDISSKGCTTPKAQRYQIPKVLTCPPAPKKPRLVSSCTLRRSPISFFDPPDIELFFASHLASIYNHVHTHVR